MSCSSIVEYRNISVQITPRNLRLKRQGNGCRTLESRTLYIEPGSPWENGHVESFIGKLRDEFLNGEIFDTLLEARVLTERWRREYNRYRPHSSLGYKPPAPEAYEVENLCMKVVH